MLNKTGFYKWCYVFELLNALNKGICAKVQGFVQVEKTMFRLPEIVCRM